MEIIFIVGMTNKNVIGKNGNLPWNYSEDMQHFKDLTNGFPCVMGRKTYDSLRVKPLPNRLNIVLTKNQNLGFDKQVKVFNSKNQVLEFCKGFKKIFIIGGEEVYKLFLDEVNVIELTLIKENFEGDTYFPKIDLENWNLISKKEYEKFDFLRYEK